MTITLLGVPLKAQDVLTTTKKGLVHDNLFVENY